MQRNRQPFLLPQLALNGIKYFVIFHHAAVGRHLHMRARKLPPRPVVVNHEVVHAEHARRFQNALLHTPHQRRVGSFSQQRVHSRTHERHAAPQDEQAHRQAYPPVQVHARNARYERRREHGAIAPAPTEKLSVFLCALPPYAFGKILEAALSFKQRSDLFGAKIPVAATHSTAQWTAENGAYTESGPTFDQKTIDAFKLTDLVKVSIELLQDSMFDLESYIAGEFARAFGIAEEEAFCVGTGTGQPTGIFTTNGGTVGVTAASATAITADELINLIYSLKSPYRRNAKFLMNDATVSMIRKLKDKNDAYLWQPSLQAGEPDKLLGYDLYTSPYVPTAKAGALTVAFGDFKNYWIADRSGRTVQRLNELYSTNGQVGFVATERVDGKVILPEGIQLLRMKASA